MIKSLKIILAGLIGGFVGEGVMGGLFMSPPINDILYDPSIQSKLFIRITPERNLALSIGGMVVLSIIHAWLFTVFLPSMPGKNWIRKGAFWGFSIWLLYWVFQEWFIYHTLINEPLMLNLLELVVLLIGSLVEGVIIASFFRKDIKKLISD